MSRERVIRDGSWIDREYGVDKWPAVLDRIRSHIASGERSLSRVIALVTRWELENPGLQSVTSVVQGERIRLPASLAAYGLYALVSEAVIAACRSDTQAIVDLGCGWGRSLFEVWLRGGPREAAYHALEFTTAGRDCVQVLAALEPGMRARTAQFDFRAPDFASLKNPFRHAVVFTVSSIHQVPLVDINAYRRLFTIAGSIDCLHFEQLGWQMTTLGAASADRDYALRNDYNRNLWQVLSELSTNREIEMVDVLTDLVGLQEHYPMSLVHWRRS